MSELMSQLQQMKADWDRLSDAQKIENLISRLRLWINDPGFTPDEVEMAMDIGINAVCIVRASEQKQQTQEAA